MDSITTVDAYIAQQTPEVRPRLEETRALIRRICPEAAEKISWGMPTYVLHGNLVHFAAHKHHMGFYPGPDAMEAFAPRLAEYKTSKGAVQFPYAAPLPVPLVEDMVRFQVDRNSRAAEEKKAAKEKANRP